jgi:hypothetical protein
MIRFSSVTDIIFFIFLYQRWIYRVDPSRVNEYGVSQEMLEVRQQNGSANAIEPAPVAEEASAAPKAPEEKKNE